MRKFHGITDFEFGTASALAADDSGTSVDEVIGEAGAEGGEASRIEFLDEEGNALDIYGNQYAGVTYARFIIKAKDPTNMAQIRSNWVDGTRQFFAADLDNGERVHTTIALNLEYCRPANIMGRKQGQGDLWELAFRVPYDDLTFAS